MGDNSVGELGDGTYNEQNAPEQIGSGQILAVSAGLEFSLFARSDGGLWGMGATQTTDDNNLLINEAVEMLTARPARLLPHRWATHSPPQILFCIQGSHEECPPAIRISRKISGAFFHCISFM